MFLALFFIRFTMKHKLLLSFFVAYVLSSCNIEQRFYFNDDFSGRMEQVIDYSGAADMMPPEEGADNGAVTLLEDSAMENIRAEIEKLDGVRLNRISDKDYKLTVELGFDHLEGLNQAMVSEAGENDDHNIYCQFERKRNKLLIRFVVEEPQESQGEQHEEGMEVESSFDDQSFYELIQYKFSFSFASPVKSHNGTPAILSDDGQLLVVEQSMKQLISEDFVAELEVLLK